MKPYLLLTLPLLLSQCIEKTATEAIDEPTPPPIEKEPVVKKPDQGFGQPLTATKGPSTVIIREGSMRLGICYTAKPNVEDLRWYNEQEQIVVKSRAAHGPATVQLFDCRTGRELGRVDAYEIKNGQPAWAASMAE